MKLRRSSSVDSFQLDCSSIPSTAMLTMVTASSPVNTTLSTSTHNSNNGSSFSTSSNNSEDQQQRSQQHQSSTSTSSSSPPQPPPPPMATFKCDGHHHNHNNGVYHDGIGGGVDSMAPRLVPSELENMASDTTANAAITNIASNHHHYYNYYYFNNKTYCGRSMIDQTTQTPEDWKTTNCSIIAATVHHHHHHHHSSLAIGQQQQQCCHNSNGICVDGTYLEHHHHQQPTTTTTPILNNPDSTTDSNATEQLNASTIAKTKETFLNNKTAAAAAVSSVSVDNPQTQSCMDKKMESQNSIKSSINANNDVAAGSGSIDGNVVVCCDFHSGDSTNIGSHRIFCCCCHHHHHHHDQPYHNQQQQQQHQHYEKTNQFQTTVVKKSNHTDYFSLVDIDNDSSNGIRNVNDNHHHGPDLGNGNNKNVDDNEHPSTIITTTKIVETAMTTSTDDNNDNNGPIDSIAATTTTTTAAVSAAIVPNTETIMANDKRCYYYWKPSCDNNINTTTAKTDASAAAAADVASVLESPSPVTDANLSRLNSNVDGQYKLAMMTKEKNPIISNNNDQHQQNQKKKLWPNQNDENVQLNYNNVDIHKLKSDVPSTNKNFNDDDFSHYPRTLNKNNSQMDVVENPRILSEIINTDNNKVGCCAFNNSTDNDDDGSSLILGDLELDKNDEDNNQENDQNLFNNFQQKSNQLRTKMIMMLMMDQRNHNNYGDRKIGRICKSENGANDLLISKCRNDYSNDNNMTMAVRTNNSNNIKPNALTISSIPSTTVNINKINVNDNQGVKDKIENLESFKNGGEDNRDDLEANVMTDSSCDGVGGISSSNKIPKSMPITIPMKSTNQQLFGFFGAYHSIDVNNNNNVNNQPIVPSGQHHQTGILSTVTNNINNCNTMAVATNHNIHNINILSSNSIEEFNQEIAELMEKNQIEYKDNDNDHNHHDGCDDNDHDVDDHRARSNNGVDGSSRIGNGNPTSSSFSIITNHHHNNSNNNGGRRAPVNELMLIAGVGDSSSSSTSYLDGGVVIVDDVAGVDDLDDYGGSSKMIAKNMDNSDSVWHDDHWSIDQTCMPFLCDDLDVDDHYDNNKDNTSSVAVDINEDNDLTNNNINDDQGDIDVSINRFISTHKRVLDETDIDQWLSDQEQQPRRPLTTILTHHKMKDINQGQVKAKSKQKLVLSLNEDLNHQQHNGASSKFAKLHYNDDNNQQQRGWENSSQMLPSPKMISSDLIDHKIFKFGSNNEEHSSTIRTTASSKPKSSKPANINSINEILNETDFTMTNNFFMEFNSRQHSHHQHSNTSTTSSTKDTSFKLKPSFQSAFLPVSELMTSNTRWMQASN